MKRGAYKNDQKRKAFNLYKQGFIVEDIAKEVNVSRKTVTLWLKEIREFDEDYIKKIKGLNDRLNTLIADPNSSPRDIESITYSINILENKWLNKFN